MPAGQTRGASPTQRINLPALVPRTRPTSRVVFAGVSADFADPNVLFPHSTYSKTYLADEILEIMIQTD